MKMKLVSILSIMLMFSSAYSILGSSENKQFSTEMIITDKFDDLDQQSTKTDKPYAIGSSDKELAQSFTPTLPVLTKVILGLKSTGNPEFYYYYVDIKSSYMGSALTSSYIDRNELVIGTGFYEFDFPDINVIIGRKYYIILRGVSDSGDLSKVYWWYGYPDPYARGDAWYESISGWNYLQEGTVRCDFVFQTYGSVENNPPYVPSQPSGSTSGFVNESYFFSTSSIDPDGDDIQYGWDWDGDNIVDEYSNLMGSGNIDSRSHSWPYAGTYNIKVKAKDELGALSGFSSSLSVTISTENNPPNKPTITGPSSGKTGNSYTYIISTEDSDDDQVFYWIDWDDSTNSGWLGPYDSGLTISSSHIWSADGTFSIKVKSKDNHGDESPWSDPLSITMPKNKKHTIPCSNPSNNIWFVRGLFKFLEEDEEYIYLKALSAKLRGFGNGLAIYHLFFCTIKISKPFYGFLSKNSILLPTIGICKEWDYI
ncbi:PKD domain-containing protein [Thermoplasmatota archaeon]